MTDTSPKITSGITVAHVNGWPETRHTAEVDGRTLFRKDGIERKFKTKAAALKAARDWANETPR